MAENPAVRQRKVDGRDCFRQFRGNIKSYAPEEDDRVVVFRLICQKVDGFGREDTLDLLGKQVVVVFQHPDARIRINGLLQLFERLDHIVRALCEL